MYRFKNISSVLILFVFVASVAAQAKITVKGDGNYPAPGKENLSSRLMGRSMPYRVILPKNYSADQNRRYPTIFLLHGLTGSSENWVSQTSLPSVARNYEFVIV